MSNELTRISEEIARAKARKFKSYTTANMSQETAQQLRATGYGVWFNKRLDLWQISWK